MASAMASQRVGARILQLPPSIRASIFQQTISKRSFSATNARRADLTTAVASGPAAVLDSLHALMPWYIAIPTAAVLVRGVLVYHLVSLPNRKRAMIRRHLYPLWNFQAKYEWAKYQDQKINKTIQRGRSGIDPGTAMWMILKRQWISVKASDRVGSTHGARVFNLTSFLNFAMMIAFTEALRIKCGVREGLLPVILNPIEWAKEAWTNPVPKDEASAGLQDMTPDELLAQRLEKAREAQEAGELPGDVTDIDINSLGPARHLSPLNTPEYAAYLDPTLQAEGLSWCSDLTAVDPTFALPAALSATIAASAFLRSGSDLVQPKDKPSIASRKESEAKVETAQLSPQSPEPIDQPLKPTANPLQAALQEADRIKASSSNKEWAPLAELTFRQRMTLTISLLFFLMSVKMPAALLLYLVPSFIVGFLQSRWLDLKYPLPEVIKPSKRPMRVKFKKTLGEV